MVGRTDALIKLGIPKEDLICSITDEVFFEPVLAAPCGHCFESVKSASVLHADCPLCRKKIDSFLPALDKKDKLEQALAADPTLYAEVYFDLDQFAEIVKKNQLKTPTGARFITLLQNAANHLNDKAGEGKYIGKSAAEVLAGNEQGRELLRHDEKIRALLKGNSPQSKPESVAHPVKIHGMFASNSGVSNQSNRPAQCVVYGDEAGAKFLLATHPGLIAETATVTDYSGRIFADVTVFQAALCAGDMEICAMVKKIYRGNVHDQAYLAEQFAAVFPNGLENNLIAQKANTFNFTAITRAMQNAQPGDFQTALAKQDNGSQLCQAIANFRRDFTQHVLAEKVFNPQHLLKALDIYNQKFDDYELNSEVRDFFWRQVIGYVERYLPACYAQALCQGLAQIDESDFNFRRDMNLHNHISRLPITYFPLDQDPTSRLGYDFGVYSYLDSWAGGRMDAFGGGTRLHRVLSKLVLRKNKQLAEVMEFELNHRARESCLLL